MAEASSGSVRRTEMMVIGKEQIVPREEVINGLARVLHSSVFINSNRLSNFLRFAVEQTLDDQGPSLKEYTIGTNAYGRRPDFDPSQDTIVRTEARRLRRKLEEYYENEGKSDKVGISLRRGGYVPTFEWRATSLPVTSFPTLAQESWADAGEVWVIVNAFLAHPSDRLASEFAFGVSEEILHRLIQVDGIRVISGTDNAQGESQCAEPPRGHIIIRGTVRSECERLRVTARGGIANGQMLWSRRFDTVIENNAALSAQEAVAAFVLSQVSHQESPAMPNVTSGERRAVNIQ
jgi:TolB-like protein